MTRATIDIGTNTAHLLIGKVIDGELKEIIYKKRHYTFLGEGGLKTVSQEAIKRLYAALDNFSEQLKNHSCEFVKVIATEGLRTASNGSEIYAHIKNHYGWDISIISGSEEAHLIFKGVQQAMSLKDQHSLIMDIGGGSVEFIESKSGVKGFTKSYKIGISRLYEAFHKDEPVTLAQMQFMESHLDEVLKEMWEALNIKHSTIQLIGCAGTFEIFLTPNELADRDLRIKVIQSTAANQLFQQVFDKDMKERLQVDGIPPERAKYIVVALSLINYMTNKLRSDTFVVCKYALKEGCLVEYFWH